MLDRSLLIVSGKGGVGKSAVTAALARLAAAEGKSVLAVALTDPEGLAAHLDLEHLGHTPVVALAGLRAMAVERVRALDEYLRLQLHLPPAAPLGQLTKLFAGLVDTVPGVREIISMGKPVQDAWAASSDVVVVDAPPLGQLFSYLAAPETIAHLVPAGAVRDQAARMRETLADAEQTGLVLVTTLEELPAIETLEAIAALEDSRLVPVAAVAANRVLEPLPVGAAALRAIPPGPVGDAARFHARLVSSQERWSARVRPTHRLPFLFGDVPPSEISSSLAALWSSS